MSFACVQQKHLWSSGYDVSLTRWRSPVRSWPGVLSIAVQKVRSKVRPGEARQAERGLAEQQHHGIKGCRGSVWHWEKLNPGRTQTCNLWFRRPTPYPLGHRTLHAKPRKDHTECGACRKIKTKEEKMTGGGFEPATLASAVGLLARRSLTRCRKCPEADGNALPYSRQRVLVVTSQVRLLVRTFH